MNHRSRRPSSIPGSTARTALIVLALSLADGGMVGCAGQPATVHSAKSPKKKRSHPKAPADEEGGDEDAEERARMGVPPPVPTPTRPAFVAHKEPSGNVYVDRFFEMWDRIHDPANGYFDPKHGIPYHAVETLLCEAPDHGHETTSEAYSYWLWLEAMYGKYTNDWKWLEYAWANMERYIVPTHDDQPVNKGYNPLKPASYAPDAAEPTSYPVRLDASVATGPDPIGAELMLTYGNPDVYAMHWLLDVDNFYGFGVRGDGAGAPVFINTFQRGPLESVWETIPHPSWDVWKFGGPHGYLELFMTPPPAKQWKYSVAPDADARAVQSVYWAHRWSGGAAETTALAGKAGKLGDYLRYALFDKYFKQIGCTSPSCPVGKDRTAAHYLLSWFFAWGGAAPGTGGWSWRIASSSNHMGYQNPMAAWVLSNAEAFKPKSKSAPGDWQRSTRRQLEFYRWLQSAEGGIAAGATNGAKGRYEAFPPDTPTFYGLGFDPSPVFLDPPSNEWFGFQAWSMERVAELYHETGDELAKGLIDKWSAWVVRESKLGPGQAYSMPAVLEWSGKPSISWDDKSRNVDFADTGFNATLHVKVRARSSDPAIAASVAKALAFHAAKLRTGSEDDKKKAAVYAKFAKELLDRMWAAHRTAKGVSMPEEHKDWKRFQDRIYVPDGFRGKMPNGDPIDKNSTFVSIRSKLKADPDWPKVERYLAGGPVPVMTYHRFWAQSEIATAMGTYGWLFPDQGGARPATNRDASAAPKRR